MPAKELRGYDEELAAVVEACVSGYEARTMIRTGAIFCSNGSAAAAVLRLLYSLLYMCANIIEGP